MSKPHCIVCKRIFNSNCAVWDNVNHPKSKCQQSHARLYLEQHELQNSSATQGQEDVTPHDNDIGEEMDWQPDDVNEYDRHMQDDETVQSDEDWEGAMGNSLSLKTTASTTGSSNSVTEVLDGAAEIVGHVPNLFQKVAMAWNAEGTHGNIYFPFACKMNFEVVLWLSQLNASEKLLDEFFKLSFVSSCHSQL